MAAPGVLRRLSAVLAADVVGYARLSGRDEAGTIARLKAVRTGFVEPVIARHDGRVVKLMGDGALFEFPSVVGAVEAAVEIQQGMAERDLDRADDDRIRFRIGINLGDIVVDGRDILGDGVNVAARLEGMAEPGGVWISGNVHEQVRDKLPYAFEDRGEQFVKNIARSVHVHALPAAAIAALPPAEQESVCLRPRATLARGTLIAVLAAGAVAAGAAGGAWRLRPSPGTAAQATRAALTEAPAPRLSIVVLPFANLGGDPEQEYFADGITDDLTTDLSRIDGSFVIARNTAFTYKNKPIDAKQLGRELGVRYILEGSLRRAGNLVRVNAQLIDAATGAEVWADRFEGDWTRSMSLQDEITGRLARTLDLELVAAESRRAETERPGDPDAVDLAMRGWSVLNQPLDRERLVRAIGLFEQAVKTDSGLSAARIGLARALVAQVGSRWSEAPEAGLARAGELVRGVLAEHPDHAMAHFVQGDILRQRKRFEAAIREYEATIAADRNFAPAYAVIGNALTRAGRSKEAFEPLREAIRRSPRDPLLNIWYFWICHAHTHLGQDEAAIEWCNRSVAVQPYWIAYVDLASAYAWTGREGEARAAVAKLRELMPGYTVDRWRHEGWSDNPVFLAEYQRIVEGLRKAGLPEG